jgi:hypothetical protein
LGGNCRCVKRKDKGDRDPEECLFRRNFDHDESELTPKPRRTTVVIATDTAPP